MVSLEKLVIQLRQKKQEASNLRQKAEQQISEFRIAEKRSTSGLHTLDKKIESEREESGDVSTVILRKNAQLESIERLIATAEDRLTTEKEAIEQAEQEIEFANEPLEKKNAETRLRLLNDRVGELTEEIKNRLRRESNSFLAFFEDYVEVKLGDRNAYVVKDLMKEAYFEYCKNEQLNSQNSRELNLVFDEKGIIHTARVDIGNQKKQICKGVVLKIPYEKYNDENMLIIESKQNLLRGSKNEWN